MKYKAIIALIVIAFGFGCIKKVEGVDELNTNIYDREYAGDAWFFIDNAYEYQNSLGQNKVRVEAYVAPENTPGLKPSNFYVTAQINDDDLGLVYAPIGDEKQYEFELNSDEDPSHNYCLTLGVFIEEDSSSINEFTECIDL